MTAAQQTDLARMRRKPLAIDLFCGLGGWSEALLAEGWDVIGFDIERHQYPVLENPTGIEGSKRPGITWSGSDKPGYKPQALNATHHLRETGGIASYPAQLVLQDVRTLHGAQFRNADLIVASPPCQFFSRMAMPFKCPWKQEEFERRRNLAHDLFWQCWRIQHEASEAKGEYIPMIVENVVGAQKWVGRSRFAYGSFHLWGDVPALMPQRIGKVMKEGVAHRSNGETNFHGSAARAKQVDDRKTGECPGKRFDARPGGNVAAHREGRKERDQDGYERNHPAAFGWKATRSSSRSSASKAASAMIAKIPPALGSHIAKVFKPQRDDRAARLWLNDWCAEEILIRLEAQG